MWFRSIAFERGPSTTEPRDGGRPGDVTEGTDPRPRLPGVGRRRRDRTIRVCVWRRIGRPRFAGGEGSSAPVRRRGSRHRRRREGRPAPHRSRSAGHGCPGPPSSRGRPVAVVRVRRRFHPAAARIAGSNSDRVEGTTRRTDDRGHTRRRRRASSAGWCPVGSSGVLVVTCSRRPPRQPSFTVDQSVARLAGTGENPFTRTPSEQCMTGAPSTSIPAARTRPVSIRPAVADRRSQGG